MSSLLLPVYNLSQENIQPKNMCVWKGERSCWDSKQNECLCRSNRPKGSLKKLLCEFSQNSQESIRAGISFLIKFNFVDLQLHKKRVFITTAELYSTKPKLRSCSGWSSARGVSEIDDGEDLGQWPSWK